MVQIKVYDAAGSQFWLDTYKDQPIKMTLAIEDIEKVSAMSAFSRTFRVPGTKNNYEYFKTMFLVEGQDFDVTRKAKAVILEDGAEFSVGHIRVQKVFVNSSNNKYEYEITYMGETRDFAAALADKPMCELEISAIAHNFDQTAVEQSWQAYPQTSTGNTGLRSGNVLYPLIDFGNTYPGTGANQNATGEPRIAVGHPSADGGSFDDHNHGIEYERFKPMLRAKCLIDQIFYDSDYTYTSNFLGDMEDPNVGGVETSLFKQIYVSAFGNDESIFVDPNIGSTNTFQATGQSFQSDNEYLECPNEISDPGNNYNPSTYTYTAPGATPGSTFTCSFAASCAVYGQQGSYGSIDSNEVRLVLYRKAYGTGAFFPTPFSSNSTDDGTCTLTVNNAVFSIGDEFRVFVEDLGGGSGAPIITSQEFACTSASVGDFNPIAYMDCEYKQIDFVKDLLTTFRLVMAPNPNKPRDFIIEPAQQYYRTGIQRDWSNKLDNSKDQVIEPLFYTQTDQIDYKHEEDEDYINSYHRDVYKENYGYLEFDSGNELLKGTREIMTKWAPTPITQIEGTAQNGGWLIPQIHTRSAEPDGTQFLPIKSKTRWLFYNGLQTLPTSTQWYFDGQAQNAGQTNWPLVSNSSTWPMNVNGTVLNWFNDIGYWGKSVPGFPTQTGQTIYETYWNNNIINTYDKYARRMTATFVLDSTDLQDLQFSDTIFVNGTWYRPEKIIDYQVGRKAKVKCQLIKVIPAYKPYLTPIQCNMTLGQEAISPQAACNNTTGGQSVTYQSTVNLQVGDDTTAQVQGQAGGYFYVVSNDCDPTSVGKVLQLDNAGVVVAIVECSTTLVYNYETDRCDGLTINNYLYLGQEENIASDACNHSTLDNRPKYVGTLQVGTTLTDFVGVSGNNGYFRILTSTETGFGYNGWVIGINDDDEVISIANICSGTPPTPPPLDPTGPIVQSNLPNIINGAVMKTDGGICVTIFNQTTDSPDVILDDSASYTDCSTCLPPQTYVYRTERCDNSAVVYAESTLNSIMPGTVVKISRNVCVTVTGSSTQTATTTMDDTVSYATCADCSPPVIPTTFNCVNGTCVDPGDGTGQFPTLADCQLGCFPPLTYYFNVLTCEGQLAIVSGSQNTVVGQVYYWGTNSGPDERGEILGIQFPPSDPSGIPLIVGPALCEIRPFL